MILDLIVLVILIFPMAAGFHRGLVNMVMRVLGWIIGVAAGFMLAGTASEYIADNHMTVSGTDDISLKMITVISFITIVLIVKLILHIIVRPAARSKKHGLLKLPDRILGMAVGGIKGIVVIFLLMTILVPVINFADTEYSVWLTNTLQDSYIAGTLYDNNLLLLMLQDFIM